MTVASGGAKTSATPTSNGRPDITRCNISRVDRAPRLFLTADTCAVRRAETQTSDRTTDARAGENAIFERNRVFRIYSTERF